MLKEQIQENLTQAVKKKEGLKSSVLRLLLASILNKEKEKRFKINQEKTAISEQDLNQKSQLSDEEIIGIISSEIKKRKEAILMYEKGNRQDLAEKEKQETDILKTYLPEQLSEQAVEKLVKEAIEKIGASELKDMGRVMSELMPKTKGRIDADLVSKIVKELLQSL